MRTRQKNDSGKCPKTGTSGVELAILAVQLDEQVAIQLLEDYPANAPLTDEMMRVTYLKLDQGKHV